MSAPNFEHQGRTCPYPEELFAFSVGQLSESASETIARHIETCPQCLAFLQKLNDRHDPLLAELCRPVPTGIFLGDDRPPDTSVPSPTAASSEGSAGAEPSPVQGGTLADSATAPPAQTAVATGGLPTVPGYQIIEEVGRGGMGVVYKAHHLALNRFVALKMILAGGHAGREQKARFRIEAEAVARLQHPNIVQIHDVGEQDGHAYLALEFVEGGSLARRHAGTPLPSAPAACLVETLARAVHHAHERNIVHRDLKPANVLLTGHGVPKITDFGLAKRLEGEGVTGSRGVIMGTPSYMAPEQARGDTRRVGLAADVYALGAILYELLTGRPPFKAATHLETLQQVVEEEPVPPRRLQPGVARDLETICLTCLHKEIARRYADAASLAEDLRRFQAGEPIVARPVGRLERGWKWARRRPAVAALLGVVALGLTGGVTGVLWYADRERVRANQESALRWEAEDQRTRAVQAEEQAKTSEAQAQTVVKFFQDKVLAAARPRGREGGLGTNATIRAALDAAEPGIAQAFAGQPAVEAAVRHTLGTSYGYLGEPGLAIRQLEQALALRQQALGSDHVDTLASMNNLAMAYKDAGQLAKALPLWEQTLAKFEEQLGPDHPTTLTSMNNLANAYQQIGQRNKALPLFEQALAQRQKQLGADHPETLESLNSLALAYKDAGHLAKALPLLEQILAKSKDQLGPNHPHTLAGMNNLASAYHDAGQVDKAIPLFELLVAKRKQHLGPDHLDTLRSLGNLAAAYYAADQVDQAVPLLEQMLAKQREQFGPDHPETLRSLNSLALSYKALGQLDKAVPLLEQVLAKRKEKLGTDHPQTLTSMNNLANAYQAAGQLDKALPLFEQALAKKKEKLGPDHPQTLTGMANLAGAYQAAGESDKALPLFEQALAKQQAKLGPDHPHTLNTMGLLAAAYLAAKQRDKALPLFKDFLGAWRKRVGPNQPRLADILAEIGVSFLKYGDPAEAETVLREALTIREANRPDAWTTFHTQSLLGGSLLGQQKYAAAEPLLVHGYEGMFTREKAIPPQHKKDLTDALDRLVQLYDAWGKKDQAEQWRQRRPTPSGPEHSAIERTRRVQGLLRPYFSPMRTASSVALVFGHDFFIDWIRLSSCASSMAFF
jgi:tetratricopeptide (TPR) repeat protein